MKTKTDLDYAIFALGGQSALARLLGISRSVVNGWLKRGFPTKRCPAIESATNGVLNRQLMRPKDWQIHWPELAVGKTGGRQPARKGASSLNKSVVGV